MTDGGRLATEDRVSVEREGVGGCAFDVDRVGRGRRRCFYAVPYFAVSGDGE